MTTSVDQRIVHAIAETIRDRVLPEVPPGWASGYLNSALQLLALLEDRMALAEGIVEADNRALRTLLENALRSLGPDGSPSSVIQAVNDGDAGHADPQDPTALNQRLRSAIEDLIVEVWAKAATSADHDAVRAQIATYRVEAMTREAPMWAQAAAMPTV